MTLINNILLRQRSFEERQLPVADNFQDLMLDTMMRLFQDAGRDKAVLNKMLELATEGIEELLERMFARVDNAKDELLAMIQPIMDVVKAFVEAAGEEDSVKAIVKVVGVLVDKIVAISGALTTENIT
ncbi:MAG: hypothetical protein AAF570_11035, partial [Bacteroidota bacterium]